MYIHTYIRIDIFKCSVEISKKKTKTGKLKDVVDVEGITILNWR